MRVCVAAGGSFHIFDLARQLQRLGSLEHLYTGVPFWKPTGLPAEKVSRHSMLLAPAQLSSRTSWVDFYNRANHTAIANFDRWVSRRIEPCDVLHTLSSFATQTQATARRKYGSLLVCERLSSHIVYQDQVLAEEFDRWKQPYHPIDPVIMEREIEEYQQSDVIVVPSHFAHRSFVAQGVAPAKVKIAPLGVDLATFRPIPKRDDVFRVLYVGMLNLRKGIPYLLEAVRSLRLPNVELMLVGPCQADVRASLAQHEGTFRYVGVVPRAKLFDYYSQGSVLVVPSVEDGFGMVMAQAMACGVPVIASQNTGGEDLFTNGVEGFVVPIRDPAAIAAKIRLLYDQPDLQKEMSRAALQRIKTLGGWNDYGNRVTEIYREALQEREKVPAAADKVAEVSSAPITSAPARRAPLPALRVSVSVGGKFHAFHLAEQLAKRGWLSQFLTTYYNPRSNAWGLDIPRKLVTSNVLPELIARIPTLLDSGPSHWFYRKGEQFDHWAARKVKPCDVFLGWSGFSRHTIPRVHDMGAKAILVRGSAHILTQKRLVDEEGQRFGFYQSELDPRTVEKELREYELADYIAMPSRFCERSFLEQGLPREKLRVWPLGADTKRFRPPTKERSDNPFRVLYVGEVSLRKGIYYLLEAFRRAALPNSELVLVGGVKSAIEPLLKNQPPSVKVLGVIRFPRLLDYYHNASIFVLPSVEDGFGQVVMQAMVTGLPVLVSSNAGASEAVRQGENGFVFEARNIDALTAQLEQLYRDPEMRRAMGKSALSSALNYTWDNYGAAVESSLLEITGHRTALET